MDIAITGASGLIGTALSQSLQLKGHRPVALVRRETKGADEIRWDAKSEIDKASLEGIGAVVHLAGAGIGDRRWSDDRKKLLLDSRVNGTRLIADTVASLDTPPPVFVSGSAIGYYGSTGDEMIGESAGRGTGFLADLVVAWEAAASPARDAGIRTVLPRTSLVLSDTGGLLKRLLIPFKLALGGRLGPGTQWMSWITLADQVRALEYLLMSDLEGPVNLCAPNPVTNNEFTKALGAAVNRPTFLPVPMIAPRLLFGAEFVDELIMPSQRVIPSVLIEDGFRFGDPNLGEALRSMLQTEGA